MPQLRAPDPAELKAWLATLAEAPLSYSHRGGVEHPPAEGFIPDRHSIQLGKGAEHYHIACQALQHWRMFPAWAVIHPVDAPQTPGTLVAMVTRLAGLWWINPCRILKRVDETVGAIQRCGFVYGTLPQHTECGEELFMVELLPDGSVWYELRAFSRPRYWLARLGFPLARWWQLKFVRDSQQAMRRIVTSS